MNFLRFTFKAIILHTLTYFICGMIFSNLFNYLALFEMPIIRDFMRGYDSPMILLGPLLQPFRGIIFALGIWPLREVLIDRKYGWLILWNTIILLGIISTPSAAPASIEGMIYSKLPLWYHVIGYPELLIQTFLFSFSLIKWEKGQLPKMLPWLFTILTGIIISVLVLGILLMS